MKRAAFSIAVTIALALTMRALSGCSSSDPAAAPDASAPDATTDVADAEVVFPTLPYPAGPYGGAIGDVFPNVSIQGYALSRTQRDSSKLPFRDVTMAEVRSDPACTCLVVLVNAAGERCGPCSEAAATLAALVASDASFCAMELVEYTYDTFAEGEPNQPPTRTDLDLHTRSARQPFPVGLASESQLRRFGGHLYPNVPNHLIVRPSDMRVVGFQSGTGGYSAQTFRGACRNPEPGPELVAQASSPRRILLDDTHLYATDAELGVFRVPLEGGARQTLATPTRAPDALALAFDDTSVVWGTRGDDKGSGSGLYEIGRSNKDGTAKAVLATSTSRFLSVGADAVNVYFTRDDGVIGKVPLDGSSGPTTILSGEGRPIALRVSATDLYWIGGAGDPQIVTVPKEGSAARQVLAEAKDFDTGQPEDLALTGSDVYVRTFGPNGGFVYAVAKTGGSVERSVEIPPSAFAIDFTSTGGPQFGIAFTDPRFGDACIGTAPVKRKTNDLNTFTMSMPSQHDIVSVALQRNILYWASDPRTTPKSGRIQRAGRLL